MPDLCEELSAHRPPRPAAVAFGVFDGVHLGHKHLLASLLRSAGERNLAPVAVTLSNHPFSVLRPEVEVRMLTSLRERLQLLAASGVEHVASVTFTREVSLTSARDFMTILRDCLGLQHFVAGPDMAVGHNREGTLPVLAMLGEELGYTLETVSQFTLDGMSVRSTAVRKALDAGDIALANRLVGSQIHARWAGGGGRGQGKRTARLPHCEHRRGAVAGVAGGWHLRSLAHGGRP